MLVFPRDEHGQEKQPNFFAEPMRLLFQVFQLQTRPLVNPVEPRL